MEIFGVLLIFIMPFLSGYVLSKITKQKGTNQIETYLIGFFFLFLIQGLVFITCIFSGQTLDRALLILKIIYGILIAAAFILLSIHVVPACKNRTKKQRIRKEEWILFGFMMLSFVLVLLRICCGETYIRQDAMLETVRTTLQTGTMFKVHPLTGQVLEMGYITSKKIVTLPLYYAFLSSITKMSPEFLLYIVITTQSVGAAFLAGALLVSDIFQRNKKRIFTFEIAYAVLLLFGDYFAGTASERLLWNGYAGDVICALIMLPYLMYLVRKWYIQENSENPPTMWIRFSFIFKLLVCLVTSLFLTGIATGFVFLLIILIILGLCCLIKTIKEVR